MKKFLTVMMLVAALTMAAPALAQSDSALIAQLQAMIVKLQEQLAQLLSNPPAAPSVQLLYPNGGEVLVTKGTYPVIWSGENFPKGTGVTLTLKDSAGEISYLATELDNTGNWDWTIGEDIEPGTYTVGIFCDKQGVDEYCSAKSYDSSNGTVKIVDERVNVPTTPSVSISCTQEGLDGSISWSGKTASDGLFWVDISRPGADSFAENTKTWNRSAEENSIDFRGFTRWDKIGMLALEPETSYLVRVSTGGQFSRIKSFKTPACATASAVRSPVEQILWPNGGETLEIGKTYVIKWAAENIPANGSITLTLKKTNTTSGENLYIKPELANTGSYWWTIPAGQPTGEYYVGAFCDLVNADGTCPGDRWDFSDRPIKIVDPLVKVVPAPVTGVPAPKITTSCVDQSGSRYQNVAIKWEPVVSGEYRIQEKVIGGSTGYFDFTGGDRIQTAGKNYAATRQYSNWGGKTIEYSVSSAAYGTSPVASVTLPQCPVSTEPTITLTSPRASQAFVIGQTYEIKWTSANFPANSSVSVALYNENKTAPVAWLIAEHPNTGVATWKVPEGQAIGTYYLAAVCDLTTPGGGQCTPGSIDFSDGPVTVARPTSSGAWKQLSGVAESLRSLFR